MVLVPAAAVAPRSATDVLDHLLANLAAADDLVLVPHSNAGLYVPALAARRHVVRAVFVDAGLPPGRPAGGCRDTVPLAPPALQGHLAALADADGLLPVWTHWWDTETVAGLFPDAATRAQLEAEQLRLPLDYFLGSVPVPPGWDTLRSAYLAFGDTYASERDAAQQRGWPTTTLDGNHLHQLSDPDGVADAIEDLLPHPTTPR